MVGGATLDSSLRGGLGALVTDVRLVVEVGEEEEHGPGVVEGDGVEEPGVVAVGAHKLVPTGVRHDEHKLNLAIQKLSLVTQKLYLVTQKLNLVT